jgi:hypothetical protein
MLTKEELLDGARSVVTEILECSHGDHHGIVPEVLPPSKTNGWKGRCEACYYIESEHFKGRDLGWTCEPKESEIVMRAFVLKILKGSGVD